MSNLIIAVKEATRATKENIPGGSSTEEQRSQTAFCPKTLRAAGLLSVAGVDSFLTARCGALRAATAPWPQPKSLAAAPLVVSKQALSQSRAPRLVAARVNGTDWPVALDWAVEREGVIKSHSLTVRNLVFLASSIGAAS